MTLLSLSTTATHFLRSAAHHDGNVLVDIFWQSTCRNIHGCSPLGPGNRPFFK